MSKPKVAYPIVVGTEDHPPAVLLAAADGVYNLAPLAAANLAGALFAAALDLLNDRGELGVTPAYFAPVVLWEKWGREDNASWVPSFLSTVEAIHKEVSRCKAEGIPYRLTLDLARDPLEVPKTPAGE